MVKELDEPRISLSSPSLLETSAQAHYHLMSTSFFSQFALKDNFCSCKNTGGANSRWAEPLLLTTILRLFCSYWRHTEKRVMNFKKGFNSHKHYLCLNMQFKKKTVDWKKCTTVLKGGEFKIKIKQHSNKWKPRIPLLVYLSVFCSWTLIGNTVCSFLRT